MPDRLDRLGWRHMCLMCTALLNALLVDATMDPLPPAARLFILGRIYTPRFISLPPPLFTPRSSLLVLHPSTFTPRPSLLIPHCFTLSSFETTTMSQQDFTSSHSERLCQTLNQEHSDAVLSMARTFTKQEVASASVVHVSQEGFKIEGTHAHGKPFQMSKPFSSPVRSMSMVKEAFLRATKLSEETSPMTPHRRREVRCPIDHPFFS
ncbi:hypothetical protein B0O80DRAFT_26319 [Mortierella sp. GBAus27b]|nr:hypothetical protein B0O80DRAFT_26319 [Mortierella sp. GBAus27b]